MSFSWMCDETDETALASLKIPTDVYLPMSEITNRRLANLPQPSGGKSKDNCRHVPPWQPQHAGLPAARQNGLESVYNLNGGIDAYAN